MASDVRAEIEVIIKDYVAFEPTVDLASKPLKELGFDSLDVMDMIFSVEKKFNIRTDFEDIDLESITVDKIVDVVQSKHSIS